ncbi:DNA-binding protein [Bradyrhizobium sp. HKCCYLS1011]|uniref:DNA-binding protein n=1 Tax=Bradyrhizobium sp. HKCCYLS1011 TaxID=3420733 RepID=UPI003EBE87C2
MGKDVKTSDDADLIGGAHRIAEFLFGSADEQLRREVYHLAEHHDLPVFKIGNKLYARRLKLHAWIEARESGAAAPRG